MCEGISRAATRHFFYVLRLPAFQSNSATGRCPLLALFRVVALPLPWAILGPKSFTPVSLAAISGKYLILAMLIATLQHCPLPH